MQLLTGLPVELFFEILKGVASFASRPVILIVDVCFGRLSCQIPMHDELAAMAEMLSLTCFAFGYLGGQALHT